MRKICFSLSTRRTASLIARFEARSCPSGFSSTMRVLGVFRPAAASCSQTVVKRDGAVARYITTVSAWRWRSMSASRCVVRGPRQVHAQEMQQGGEAVELLGRWAAWRSSTSSKRDADQRAVLLVAQVVARNADDAAAFGQRAVAEGLEQCGHQLAPGEVAGAAEQDEVEAHGLDNVTWFQQLEKSLVRLTSSQLTVHRKVVPRNRITLEVSECTAPRPRCPGR